MFKKFLLPSILLGLVFLFCTTSLFAAAPKDLAKRFLTKAEDAITEGDIDRAYNYVNTALVIVYEDFFAEDEEGNRINTTIDEKETDKLISFAQAVYSRKIKQLIKQSVDKSKSYDDIELEVTEIKMNITKYPLVNSYAISDSLAKISSMILDAKNNPESASDVQLENFELQLKELGEAQDILADSQREFRTFEDVVSRNIEQTNRSANIIAFAVISISAIVLIVIILIFVVCKKGFAQQHQQQEQYIQAFKMMSNNQNYKNPNVMGAVTGIYGSTPLKIAETCSLDANSIPKIDFDISDEKNLKDLAIKCEELGCKIDSITNRKNNSKNVSEIVYKLSLQLGLSSDLALLYFCAAMVYDAGFLGVDPDLLSSIFLTKEEKEAIKIHVSLAEDYLDFVPEKFKSIFQDAVMKHHENMDGSGYPKGLKGEEIPLIARLIHIAESYISISSKRSYRAPIDKETAVSKIREDIDCYDADIVDALEKIV